MQRWTYSLFYPLLCLGFFLGGCRYEKESTALLIEKPVTTRPIVAIVPVIDNSRHELAWNVSQELTTSLRHRLAHHNRLYLLSEDQVYALSRKSSNQNQDPFSAEISWVKKGFPDNEFVAFFDLIEHGELPLTLSDTPAEESPAELNISMRVRAFDLRGEEPKVVLEEVVEQSHHIPQQFTRNQFSQVPWGDEMFEISPLGLAHEKLCQEVASRLEDYILLNCKS